MNRNTITDAIVGIDLGVLEPEQLGIEIARTFAVALQVMDGWHHGMNCANGSCEPCAWVQELSRHGEQPMSLDQIIERANRRAQERMS
jgi:hypothetical protein